MLFAALFSPAQAKRSAQPFCSGFCYSCSVFVTSHADRMQDSVNLLLVTANHLMHSVTYFLTLFSYGLVSVSCFFFLLLQLLPMLITSFGFAASSYINHSSSAFKTSLSLSLELLPMRYFFQTSLFSPPVYLNICLYSLLPYPYCCVSGHVVTCDSCLGMQVICFALLPTLPAMT